MMQVVVSLEHALHRVGETGFGDRFEDEVDGRDVERLRRIALKRGHENEHGSRGGRQRTCQLDPPEPWQFDLQKYDIRRLAANDRDCVLSIVGFTDDLDPLTGIQH